MGTGWEGQEGRAVPRFCRHRLYGSETDEGRVGGRDGVWTEAGREEEGRAVPRFRTHFFRTREEDREEGSGWGEGGREGRTKRLLGKLVVGGNSNNNSRVLGVGSTAGC